MIQPTTIAENMAALVEAHGWVGDYLDEADKAFDSRDLDDASWALDKAIAEAESLINSARIIQKQMREETN